MYVYSGSCTITSGADVLMVFFFPQIVLCGGNSYQTFEVKVSSAALICLFTPVLSVILHSRGPVHKTSKGYQVEGEREHVHHEEVVGGQALQVDEGFCQGMGQQALSAKLQECCQDLAFRCGPVL